MPLRFGLGELAAAVDAGDFLGVVGGDRGAGAPVLDRDIDDIGEVVLALRIVVVEPVEEVEQILGARGHQARIAQPTGALGLVRVLELDHFLDGGIGMGDDAAVLQRVVGLEAEYDHGGRIGRAQPVEHILHGLRLDKGRIAQQHQHVACEVLQRLFRLRDRVAGAELRLLHHAFGAAADLVLDLLALVADDDDGARGRQSFDRSHQMLDDRAARHGVKDLVQPAIEAGALARGKDDGGEFAVRVHGAVPCHQSLAV